MVSKASSHMKAYSDFNRVVAINYQYLCISTCNWQVQSFVCDKIYFINNLPRKYQGLSICTTYAMYCYILHVVELIYLHLLVDLIVGY